MFFQCGDIGDAAGQLHVAHRAGRRRHGFFRQQIHIFFGQPYAVRRRGGNIKKAEIVKVPRGGLAVTGNTFFMLFFRFGKMQLHTAVFFLGVGRHIGHDLR